MRTAPPFEVFTRSEALAHGWTDPALKRAVNGGRLVRPRRGLFAAPGGDPERVRTLAAAIAVRDAVVSHRSALLLHGLPVVGSRPLLPEITVGPRGRGSADATHLHRASLPDSHVVTLPVGVRATTIARTLVDVARSRPVTTAVAAMDAALHRELVGGAELDAVCLRCWNWPGIRRAHRAISLADPRAESPLESISRLVLRWLRLPIPDLQRVALDRQGHEAGRLDFYWEEQGVAGEADGRGKYDARDVLTAEKERQEHLEQEGLVVVRWGWSDVTRYPHRLRTRVDDAFERGRARDRSGLPRQWSIQPRKSTAREEDVIKPPPTAGRPRACP